jgi:hypothetical protein
MPEPARPGVSVHETRKEMIRSSELVAFESVLADPHISGML